MADRKVHVTPPWLFQHSRHMSATPRVHVGRSSEMMAALVCGVQLEPHFRPGMDRLHGYTPSVPE